MSKLEKVKNAPSDTILPKRGTKHSAGYDFYAPCDIKVPAKGFSALIPFNVKVYMRRNQFLGIYIRSSLATGKDKVTGQDLRLQVSQGTAIIDADYVDNPENDGNIGIMFENRGDKSYTIPKGTRCAQGILQRYYIMDDDDCREERKGGYGSTGR